MAPIKKPKTPKLTKPSKTKLSCWKLSSSNSWNRQILNLFNLKNFNWQPLKSRTNPFSLWLKRWSTIIGISLIILLTLISFLLPKNNFQKAKERLLRNPNDFEARLILAEEFLKNNQFEEAEKELRFAEQQQASQSTQTSSSSQILGSPSKLSQLWKQKQLADPQDISRLITAWEKILTEKPGYRDGWLQLAFLHAKLNQNEKAKECLKKTLALDPNFTLARELEKILP